VVLTEARRGDVEGPAVEEPEPLQALRITHPTAAAMSRTGSLLVMIAMLWAACRATRAAFARHSTDPRASGRATR